MKLDKNEFPLLIKNSIKAIRDENRQKILMFLFHNGSKSFIEISKELKIAKNNLSHHIKNLMLSGLLYNYYNRNQFADKYSFYEVSKLGKKLIEALLGIMKPKIPRKTVIPSLKKANEYRVGSAEENPIPIAVRVNPFIIPVTAETGIIDEQDKIHFDKEMIENIWR